MLAWPIVTGCERLSPGCSNCPSYWEYVKMGWDYHPIPRPEYLDTLPKKSSVILVAPGSDLLHEAIRVEYIEIVIKTMALNLKHTFQVVTKRAERLEALDLPWPGNVTIGVAVEEERYKWRIDCLRHVRANRFVSFGPLTGSIGKINLTGINYAGVVIETWGTPRPYKQEWVDEIHDQCIEQEVTISTDHWLVKETV